MATTTVRHLICGTLHVPPRPQVVCHCLLLMDPAGMALVDTGIGLEDITHPAERIGPEIIAAAGFQFREELTAIRQLQQQGISPNDVRHLVLTHADPDHVGGLADFPWATVHISAEERAAIDSGNPRYCLPQFEHGPRWQSYAETDREWFGLPARTLPLSFQSEVLLVPLFGHTAGHCGVAISQGDAWLLHVGDAYYLRAELATDDNPGSQLAAIMAVDNARRQESLEQLRRLVRDHSGEISMIGYHDPREMPVYIA